MKVNYKVIGEGDLVVLLHGWGQNIQMMEPLINGLKNKKVLILDLPGFGQSDEPETIWKIEDYAEFINKFVNKLGFKKCSIIGHSFGGKIGLYYASKYDTEKLVVFGSPYKKEISKLSFKTKLLKKIKRLIPNQKLIEFAKKHTGSIDYRSSSPKMREILTSHVNNDITDSVKKISCPTLIIWGDNDTIVDKENAYELEKLIKDSATIILPGSHYAYLENINQVNKIINNFLGGTND